MKKITFLLGSFSIERPGGAEQQALYLANECLSQGFKVSYIYLTSTKAIPDSPGLDLYPIERSHMLERLGSGFLIYRDRVRAILERIKPDIIYQRCGSALTGISAAYSRANEGCRLIWHIASEVDVRPFRFAWRRTTLFDFANKKVLEYGIRNADVVVGQARYQERLMYEHYGRKCDVIVPNFHPVPHQLAKDAYPLRVVWVANFKRLKRPELFLRLAELLSHHNSVRFTMIGRAGRQKWQLDLMRRIKAVDTVEYLGEKSVEDVNNILGKSHVLVNTSLHEGFPNTFIQAWMQAVPVVSLNVDPDDVLKENELGFHSVTFKSLARDVEGLLLNKGLREAVGDRARKYAQRHHSIDVCLPKMITLINEVGGNRRRSHSYAGLR